MEQPNVLHMLANTRIGQMKTDMSKVSFYLGRENLLTSGKTSQFKWRKSLFAFMYRNAEPATSFFRIPSDLVIEIGSQVEI